MKIELRNIEIYEKLCDETLCFSAELEIDGTFVATVCNNGQGESNRYDFEDNNVRRRFIEYCRNLPDFDSPYGKLPADEDMIVGDLIAKASTD
ncbi:MAG TPA: hypothetical protein DET40_18450 [Lentisphaeria bacterium]|nr:MAG: hypothetical protein A2X45_14590 [Lentisphaerae bacterium GWF2_50_93]HCE45525.1 hypothetical protein [Lentisphaeria bacterium]